MRVVTKQFTKEVLLSTAFVLFVLVALFGFFELIQQLEEVRADYPISLALLLTGLTLPLRVYEIMPIAVLLAAVYTMSRWASTSEFTALRVAGLSPLHLTSALLIPGIVLVGLTFTIGEYVSPWASRYALTAESQVRDRAITARGFDSGVWVRDVVENERIRYINVKALSAADRSSTGAWRMFEYDAGGRLLRMVHAEAARFERGHGWELRDVRIVEYPEIDREDPTAPQEPIRATQEKAYYLPSEVGPDILNVMTSKPEHMSMQDLARYIAHLESTGQSAERYQVTLWSKAFYPVAVLVMLALAMPFAYMNARSGGLAIKMFFGVLIGILFYALNNVFSYVGTVNTWPPLVATLTPSVVMLALAAGAMYWVEHR